MKFFGGFIINGFYIEANFSNNNGSIWINNLNEEMVWQDFLDEYIEAFIYLNGSSSKNYNLWANSTTPGNNTLYYTFRPEIIHTSNIGLAVLIIFLPIIIVVIIVVEKCRKKESRTVRFAKKVGERLALKLEDKYKEKITKILGDKAVLKKIICPKCGFRIMNIIVNFCKECGFQLRE